RAGHYLPDFDGHVHRGPSLPWRRGRPGGNRVGLIRTLDVHDPIPGEKLLGFGEHAVGDGRTVLPGSHDLGLTRVGHAFGAHDLSGFAESRIETDHEPDVRLYILLRQ